jgi:hypothetical protein
VEESAHSTSLGMEGAIELCGVRSREEEALPEGQRPEGLCSLRFCSAQPHAGRRLQLALGPDGELVEVETQGEEELAELGIDGRDLVEAHLVDQLLEDDRIFCEE